MGARKRGAGAARTADPRKRRTRGGRRAEQRSETHTRAGAEAKLSYGNILPNNSQYRRAALHAPAMCYSRSAAPQKSSRNSVTSIYPPRSAAQLPQPEAWWTPTTHPESLPRARARLQPEGSASRPERAPALALPSCNTRRRSAGRAPRRPPQKPTLGPPLCPLLAQQPECNRGCENPGGRQL